MVSRTKRIPTYVVTIYKIKLAVKLKSSSQGQNYNIILWHTYKIIRGNPFIVMH